MLTLLGEQKTGRAESESPQRIPPVTVAPRECPVVACRSLLFVLFAASSPLPLLFSCRTSQRAVTLRGSGRDSLECASSPRFHSRREHTNYIFDVTKDHLEEVLG